MLGLLQQQQTSSASTWTSLSQSLPHPPPCPLLHPPQEWQQPLRALLLPWRLLNSLPGSTAPSHLLVPQHSPPLRQRLLPPWTSLYPTTCVRSTSGGLCSPGELRCVHLVHCMTSCCWYALASDMFQPMPGTYQACPDPTFNANVWCLCCSILGHVVATHTFSSCGIRGICIRR